MLVKLTFQCKQLAQKLFTDAELDGMDETTGSKLTTISEAISDLRKETGAGNCIA